MGGGRSGGFVSFPGTILIIVSTSFSKRIKICVIIIVWLAFLTHGNELDNLLGKGFLNDLSQWAGYVNGGSRVSSLVLLLGLLLNSHLGLGELIAQPCGLSLVVESNVSYMR